MDENEIRKKLLNLGEENYKNFSSSLIPNVNNMIGVRIPVLKKIAKQLSKEPDVFTYIENANSVYFEETMLKGLIIGYLKVDFNTILEYIKLFVPQINNWSVCDSFCANLKVTIKHKDEMFDFILGYRNSKNEFELRFMVVMLLDYFISEKYIDIIFSVFDSIKKEDYYVKTAIAWGLSSCFIKFPIKTKEYLIKNNLDDFTHNKTLQKCIESYRVSENDKLYLRKLKR